MGVAVEEGLSASSGHLSHCRVSLISPLNRDEKLKREREKGLQVSDMILRKHHEFSGHGIILIIDQKLPL